MKNSEIAIVAATRTPIGNLNGSLAGVMPHKLSQILFKRILEKTEIAPSEISEVIMGQVLTTLMGQNPARQASVAAGIPQEVPAWTVNQVCGSGLRSVAMAAQAISSGFSNIVIAGGHESMSLSPHAIHMRNGCKMGDSTIRDTMIYDGLTDAFSNLHMGITAENIASRFNITRREQDEFALNSQQKAQAAESSGQFAEEITPISVQLKRQEISFATDEFIRHNATIEDLSKLKPAFQKDGTVTAGNASGINDGAAAVLLMPLDLAIKKNLEVLGIIRSFAHAGVAPEIMGTGPVPACTEALRKINWKVSDLDLIEANEAFAVQAIYVNRQMGWDTSKVNVNGGAIALGHPIGASGARILVTLLHAMRARGAKKGLATLCVGGGMGVAMCIERQ